ncbi:MAG TPA: wax ester/triacylglycerol synthase family O-acyltransferase [Capillimicrobium sp.]|nr:wax ester/triacylglycerol synthase family O-acyltransferase [Capillimicrobium sp.]
MGNPDRLSGLDASFLHLEEGGTAHMHVASVLVFEGDAPGYVELVEHIASRLDLVPRYRQRLATVPLGQGRPVWVDDPHFNVRYHVRHTGLPHPGDDAALKTLAGRLFAQPLDRNRPLWELWLVEGLAGDRFAVIGKTHHALVDGVSGVDITTVLFDTAPDPAPVPRPATPWVPRPAPTGVQLLADALVERATVPAEMVRGVRAALRAPMRVLGRARQDVGGIGTLAWNGLRPAPRTPYNVRIGPHRRYEWVDADLRTFKAIKNALGGTVNDVVLAVVAGALGRHLRTRGEDTDGLVLRALVPVSVRTEGQEHALGNRVAAMWAPLPVGETHAAAAFAAVRDAMAHVKASGEAVGAQALTELTDFAPPTIMSQAARLQARQRLFNVVVTNVPGPQFPLYLLGRRLRRLYPVVPLAANCALGIAIMSYDGALGFGLLGDLDTLPDLDVLAKLLDDAIDDLARAAGVPRDGTGPGRGGGSRSNGSRPRARATAGRA